MTTPEGIIENYFVKRVRETGGKVRKLKWIGHNGAPDRMVWWPAKKEYKTPLIYFIELKAPGKKATPQQKSEHIKMIADGLHVRTISSIDGVDRFLGEALIQRTLTCK